MPEPKASTRRHLLKTVLRGIPAVAAGGILAHTGLLTLKGKKPIVVPTNQDNAGIDSSAVLEYVTSK
jgi:hypothetical protein